MATGDKTTPPGPATPQPALSPDTNQLAAQYGLDPTMIGTGLDDDEDSMKVFKRTIKKAGSPGRMNMTGGLLGLNLQDPWLEGEDGGESDETDTVGNYKKDYYRKAPGELGPLKRRLWEGGFYDASISWEDVRQNDYDEETNQAWARAVKRAAAFYDAGKKLTVDEVIDMAAANMSDEEKASGKRSGSGQGRPGLSVELTHPDDIKTTAMKVSARTLGKGWSDDQLNRFVATFQAMERSQQANQYAATGQGGGTYTGAPNMEAQIEKEARRQDPVAAGATDYVNAYSMIIKAFQSLGSGAGS
jgi:hypothetical protein